MLDLSRKELALNGGCPIRVTKWKDNVTTGKEEKDAVLRVMESGYLSLFEGSHYPDEPFSFYGGSEVQALEEDWRDYYGVEYALSLNSATSCLYAAIGALEIGYGDEVIVSPYTMTACALAPLIYGAIPIFADVDLHTGSMSAENIEKVLSPKTKAIVIVHQFGIPAEMKSILSLAKQHNLRIIEDCAQAHGAKLNDKYVGTFGDIGVFSLNVNKSIQCGEGGICVTEDQELAYRLALIRNHGEAVVGPASYENITNIAGFNYRLTEIQAAIAREQLKKLDELNMKRLKMVEYLSAEILSVPFLAPLKGIPEAHSTYYVYPMRYDENKAGVPRDDFVRAINAEGALFYQGYTPPLYLQPVYQNRTLFKHGYPFTAKENRDSVQNYKVGICPNTERLHYKEMIINEHVRHPQGAEDVSDLINCIKKVVGDSQ